MITANMHARLAAGLDPLTGTQLVTVGKIAWKGGVCRDETGREVTLDDDGRWIYAAEEKP